MIEGNSSMFGGAIVQLANDANEFGLGLNNAGDFIRLLNADGVEVAGLLYEATDGDNGSRVREPELTGDFVYHLDVADSPALFIYTPGFSAKAEPFCTLTLALSAEVSPIRISEDAGVGASTLTLTRTGPTNAALTVTLATDDPSEISLPSTVEIPDGEAFVVVPIDAVNDEAQDGDIVVRITASAPEFLTGTVEIQVLDDGDAPTMLVINEIDADQPGTDMGEFIELYDGGVGNLPLDGFVLVLFNGSNNESYATYDLAGSSTNAEGYFVIGQADVRHVNLAVNGFTLQNGPDGVALYRGVGSQFPNGSFPIDDDLVDALVYGTDDPDADGLLTDLLPDQAQVNEGTANNNESIGRENDGGDPLNTSAFVSMVPSPGAANGSVQGAAYALWESQFPDLGGQEDDPDGDGLSNALEYAFGLNPLASEPGQHLSVTREDGTFVVSIPAPEPIPEDVSLAIEASTTLDQWEPQPGLSGSIQNGLFRIRASDALTDAPTAFIRIVATIAP